jgi:hypothetical protein
MTHHHDGPDDRELDRLLAAASSPVPPLGAEARLLRRIASTELEKPAALSTAPRRTWLAGVPLAASLILGLYVGANGVGTDFLSGEDPDVASLEESFGLEEVELAAEEDLS